MTDPNAHLRRPWVCEQHIDIPELAGQWLTWGKFMTEREAHTQRTELANGASSLETFRVRNRNTTEAGSAPPAKHQDGAGRKPVGEQGPQQLSLLETE